MGKIQSEIFPFVHFDIAWFNASVAKKREKSKRAGEMRRNDESKIYISQLVTINEYATWLSGKKVMLVAPTGLGKTKFVLSKFLPFCVSQRRKVAILCNRRLLREQYLYDLAEMYTRYYIMNEQVQLFTYQTLAEYIMKGQNLGKYWKILM